MIGIGLAEASARADIIVQHSGNINPTTEGFLNNSGGLPVSGSASGDAWYIAGDDAGDYDEYIITGPQDNILDAAATWTLTATFSDLAAVLLTMAHTSI
jgi:hypothetical protein